MYLYTIFSIKIVVESISSSFCIFAQFFIHLFICSTPNDEINYFIYISVEQFAAKPIPHSLTLVARKVFALTTIGFPKKIDS